MFEIRGTTIIGVKKDNSIVVAGDGQVTLSESVIMKGNARKVRRIYNDQVVVGFAGSTADAFTLLLAASQDSAQISACSVRVPVEL